MLGSLRTTTQNRHGYKLGGCSISAEQQKLVDAHFQASAAYWKELYQREDLNATIHRERRGVVLALVDKLGLPPESRLLEIGCGSGTTTVALAQRGYLVEAVDTVNAMLDLTRQLAVEAGAGNRVMTRTGDVHCLAFPDKVFELALAMGVVPYLHSPAKAIEEMARVLRPGGYLIVNADNRWRLNYVLDPRRFPAFAAFRWKLRDAVEHSGLLKPLRRARARVCSLKEFDALLSLVGLEKLEGMTLGFGSFSFFNQRLFPDSWEVKIHHKLQSLADRGFPLIRSTGAQYIVLARKPGAKLALDIANGGPRSAPAKADQGPFSGPQEKYEQNPRFRGNDGLRLFSHSAWKMLRAPGSSGVRRVAAALYGRWELAHSKGACRTI